MTIGILGCMAERLKSQLLDEEKIVDLVVGPDAYRDLPNLVKIAEEGQKGVNTFLSERRNLCRYITFKVKLKWSCRFYLHNERL